MRVGFRVYNHSGLSCLKPAESSARKPARKAVRSCAAASAPKPYSRTPRPTPKGRYTPLHPKSTTQINLKTFNYKSDSKPLQPQPLPTPPPPSPHRPRFLMPTSRWPKPARPLLHPGRAEICPRAPKTLLGGGRGGGGRGCAGNCAEVFRTPKPSCRLVELEGFQGSGAS